jgi:TrmH family RNA methyltransferase
VRAHKLAADPGAYRKLGEVWIEGEHLCSALVEHGGAPSCSFVSEAAWDDPRLRALASHAASVAVLPQVLMHRVSGLESAPPIAFVVPWAGPGTLAPGRPSVVLDRLQDAGNVGTILRSAGAFGFRQVLAMKGTAALWGAKVLRAGMGAHFGLHLIEGLEPERLSALKVPLLATSSHQGDYLHRATLPWPCAWVLGHEGQGVSTALAERASQFVRIVQPGGEESLNVGAAAAICLHASAAARVP